MKTKHIILISVVCFLFIFVFLFFNYDIFNLNEPNYISKTKLNNYTTRYVLDKNIELIVSYDQNSHDSYLDFRKEIKDSNTENKRSLKSFYKVMDYLEKEYSGFKSFYNCEKIVSDTNYFEVIDSNCYFKVDEYDKRLNFDIDFNNQEELYIQNKIKINADLLYYEINLNKLYDSNKLKYLELNSLYKRVRYFNLYYLKVKNYKILK